MQLIENVINKKKQTPVLPEWYFWKHRCVSSKLTQIRAVQIGMEPTWSRDTKSTEVQILIYAACVCYFRFGRKGDNGASNICHVIGTCRAGKSFEHLRSAIDKIFYGAYNLYPCGEQRFLYIAAYIQCTEVHVVMYTYAQNNEVVIKIWNYTDQQKKR